MRTLIASLLAASALAAELPADIPAFPGAQGYGASTVHGRGGRVIAVTNLADSGPGSLRAAVEASGPRIVVFRVGGLIRLRNRLYVREPYLYLAGQTAPGDGICLADGQISIATHDVVIRFLRSRAGDTQTWNPSFDNIDAIEIANATTPPHRIVIDHCSFSWGVDETASCWYACNDITWQWNIFSEGLHASRHSKGPHGKGMLIGEQADRIAIHHNLFAHNHDRNPMLKGDTAVLVANNTVYNWGGGRDSPQLNYTCAYLGLEDTASGDPARLDFLGNRLIPGPDSYTFAWGIRLNRNMPGASGVFLHDNQGPGRPDASGDEWLIMRPGDESYRVGTRTMPDAGVAVRPVAEASARVLAHAGASLPQRDSVDQRIVSDVHAGSGRVIDSQSEVGGWPTYASGNVASDADGDGMADAWELANGLSPSTASDGAADSDGDGYTNVEEYLESLVPRDAYGEPDDGEPDNRAPTMSAIADRTTTSGTAISAIAFTVADHESAPSALTVTGSSSTQALVADGALVFAGSGADRTLTLTPVAGRSGSAVITVRVSDGLLSASRSFLLTVTPRDATDPTPPAPPATAGGGSDGSRGCGLGGGLALAVIGVGLAGRRRQR